jgi:hypothetical protein
MVHSRIHRHPAPNCSVQIPRLGMQGSGLILRFAFLPLYTSGWWQFIHSLNDSSAATNRSALDGADQTVVRMAERLSHWPRCHPCNVVRKPPAERGWIPALELSKLVIMSFRPRFVGGVLLYDEVAVCQEIQQ